MARKPPVSGGRSKSLDRLVPFDDECLLVVAANSAAHRSIRELRDLSRDLVAQIEHFFVSYNEIKGKRFEVKGQAGSKRAVALVAAAMKKRKGR